MKGLRAAAWGAAGTVAAGLAAVALIVALLPAVHASEAIGGATYASVAQGRRDHLVVTSLRTGCAEAFAGLRVGDQVTAVNGIDAPSLGALRHEMAARQTVALIVQRGGDAIPVTLLHATRETHVDEDPAGRGR